MSAHTVLQRHLNHMQVISDQREKLQIVEFLPQGLAGCMN